MTTSRERTIAEAMQADLGRIKRARLPEDVVADIRAHAAVVAVLRVLWRELEEDLVGFLCFRLDVLAGRRVGTLLREVRGDADR